MNDARSDNALGSPGGNEDVRIGGAYRHSEVGAIQDVKKLRPKLHIKILRNSLNAVVLEQGEIQVRQPGPVKTLRPALLRRLKHCGATPTSLVLTSNRTTASSRSNSRIRHPGPADEPLSTHSP